MPKRSLPSAACVLLPFLLFPPECCIPSECWIGGVDECKRNEEFVPGYDLAGRGIDITTLTATENNVLDLREWRDSSGGCILCENLLLKRRPHQRLPLVFSGWKTNFSCQQRMQHSVHQPVITAARQLTQALVRNEWKRGLEVDVKPMAGIQRHLAGSQSRVASFIKEKSARDKYNFLLHHISCT